MKSGQLKSGLILSYAAIFIQSIVSIVYTPVMLRLLGQHDYGLLQLAVSAVSNLGILGFGFGSSYLRFYSEYKSRGDDNSVSVLNGMFLIIYTCAAFVCLVSGSFIVINAATVFPLYSHEEIKVLKTLLSISCVNLALSFPVTVFDSYIVAQERFAFQKGLIILSSLLNPLITTPLLMSGHGSTGAALCMTVITLIKLIVCALYCILRLNMRFTPRFDISLLKRLSLFSFFIFLNMVSDQINWSVDKLLLGIFRGADTVTQYSLASQFNSYFLTVSYALYSLLTPRAHRLVAGGASDKVISDFFMKFGQAQFLIMAYIFLVIAAVGKPFFRIWSGLDTDTPFFTALILTLPVLIISTQEIGIEIQRAKDMHRFRSVLYILVALFNLVISIPLCRVFGALGCAAGTCICLAAGNIVIMNIYYHRRVGLDIALFLKGVCALIPSLLPPLITAVLIYIFARESILYIAVFAALLSAVYWLSVWFLGLRSSEKHYIKNPLTRRGG